MFIKYTILQKLIVHLPSKNPPKSETNTTYCYCQQIQHLERNFNNSILQQVTWRNANIHIVLADNTPYTFKRNFVNMGGESKNIRFEILFSITKK